MMKTCSYCGGSGRNATNPSHASCLMCNGSGEVLDYDQKQHGSLPKSGNNPIGCLSFILLILLGFGFVSYFYSSTIVFSHWDGPSSQNWAHFGIYSVVSISLVWITSRFFGFIAGCLIGVMFLLPVIESISVGNGYYWIVFREEVSASTTRGVRWLSFVSALFFQGVLAYYASLGRTSKYYVLRGGFNREMNGTRIAQIILAVILLITFILIEMAVGFF